MLAYNHFRELFQPPQHRLWLREVLFMYQLDQPRDPLHIPRQQRSLDRFHEQGLLLVPRAGPQGELAQGLLAQPPSSLLLHGRRKERVIAIPSSGTRERLQKESAAFDCF